MLEDIRIRVAGIFVENGRILLVKHRKFGKEYFLLPGGGQHTGESAGEALIREWDEELGLKIEVGKFLFCGESIPPAEGGRKHVYQMVFQVDSIGGELAFQPDGPLVGFEWVDLSDLPNITLFPVCLDQLLSAIQNEQGEPYTKYVWTA